MSDDEDDVIRCPFCDATDGCNHLVASLDHENAAIGGGVCLDREEEITTLIHEQFIAIGPASDRMPPRDFTELWSDFQSQPDEPLDCGLVAHLLDDLLANTEAIREENEGVVAYFDRKPAKVVEEVLKAIQQARGVNQ